MSMKQPSSTSRSTRRADTTIALGRQSHRRSRRAPSSVQVSDLVSFDLDVPELLPMAGQPWPPRKQPVR
jgi:hypothetical protein